MLTCRSFRSSIEVQMKRSNKCSIAPIRQWSYNQPFGSQDNDNVKHHPPPAIIHVLLTSPCCPGTHTGTWQRHWSSWPWPCSPPNSTSADTATGSHSQFWHLLKGEAVKTAPPTTPLSSTLFLTPHTLQCVLVLKSMANTLITSCTSITSCTRDHPWLIL